MKLAANKKLLMLLGACLIARLVFSVPVFIDPSRAMVCTDARTYDSIARNLLAGNGFSMSRASPYVLETTVTPGYPFFLAAVYAVSSGSRIAVVLIQLVLNLVLLTMLYQFIRHRFGERPALFAGILFILELNLALFTNQITTETLFTFLFIPALILAIKGFERNRFCWPEVIGAGLLLGAATLVRPVVLYFGIPLLVFILLWRFKWRKLVNWGIIVFLQLVLIAPWVIRNRIIFGETFYSTVSAMNLARYHAAPLKAGIEGIPREEAAQALRQEALEGKTWDNDARYFKLIGAQARRYLIKHPLRYVGASVIGGVGTLCSPLSSHEVGNYFGGHKPPPQGSIMVQMLAELSKGRIIHVAKTFWQERLSYYGTFTALLFLIYGLFHLAKLGLGLRAYIIGGLKAPVPLLFLITGIYLLGLMGLAIVPRLRVPVEPLLVGLAGIGFCLKARKKDSKKETTGRSKT